MKTTFRRILVLFCSTLFIIQSAKAQSAAELSDKKHELRVQVQDGLPITIAFAFGHVIRDIFSSYQSEEIGRTSFPMLGLGYRYHISERVNVGILASYMQNKRTYKLTKTGEEDKEAVSDDQFFFVTPVIEYAYLNRENVRLYGSAAAGLAILKSSYKTVGDSGNADPNYALDFQVNPIGIRVGRQIAGYAELGFGLKGIITLGVSARF